VSPLRGSGIFPIHTRGLRPGLNALPPLRGWFNWDSNFLSRYEIAFPVATQSLKPSVGTTKSSG
jgi:hypothetical protein